MKSEKMVGRISKAAKLLIAPAVLLAAVAGCDIDKTEDGEMPSVDVDVKSGSLPKYDVDVADVEVGMKKEKIMVPEVNMVEKEVSVPTVGVDMPDDDRPE